MLKVVKHILCDVKESSFSYLCFKNLHHLVLYLRTFFTSFAYG